MEERGRSNTIEVVFGVVVRQRRKALRMSQERLALDADLNRTYVSDVERGLKVCSLTTLEKIAAALETTPSALLREVEEQRP